MKFTLEIVNQKGLHARASAKFVETVEHHRAEVTVRKDGLDVSGDSIMGLMSLGAAWGSTIEIEAQGEEAEAVASALRALIANRFGEPS